MEVGAVRVDRIDVDVDGPDVSRESKEAQQGRCGRRRKWEGGEGG